MTQILNLGCGRKTCNDPDVINIDWSILLRLKKNRIWRPIIPIVLKGERFDSFKSLPDNIVVHDLSKGIPFEPSSVDVVYHSHLLEHLDRHIAKRFALEVKRVLKPGGIHRIVVPDLEQCCKAYISHLSECDENPNQANEHDSYIAEFLEQSVRKEASGTSQQKRLRRFFENIILGDARRRGETHQWMYDRINLKAMLINTGYNEVHIQNYNTSLIPKWNEYSLDIDKNSDPYKPGSLYVEAVK